MLITLVGARDVHGNMGYKGKLPWGRMPEDLERFHKITAGQTIIVGRRTLEGFGGKAIARGRKVIVLSWKPKAEIKNVHENTFVARNPEHALLLAEEMGTTEVFVVGGSITYQAFMPIADKVYLTWVGGVFEGDCKFPQMADHLEGVVEGATALDETPALFFKYTRRV